MNNKTLPWVYFDVNISQYFSVQCIKALEVSTNK